MFISSTQDVQVDGTQENKDTNRQALAQWKNKILPYSMIVPQSPKEINSYKRYNFLHLVAMLG